MEASADHDPFNEPETAHPRARELLSEAFFWDCVDEEAPFGSDEGHDAYYEYRRWRAHHRDAPLLECLSWILDGRLDEYGEALADAPTVSRDVANPSSAKFASSYDMFTLDATILATCLGQLLDEGRIDEAAKPYARVAINRQLHPEVVTSEHRRKVLEETLRVLDRA